MEQPPGQVQAGEPRLFSQIQSSGSGFKPNARAWMTCGLPVHSPSDERRNRQLNRGFRRPRIAVSVCIRAMG